MSKIVTVVFEKWSKNHRKIQFFLPGSFKKFFFEKRAQSVFSEYRYLTSDQKLAKSLERLLRSRGIQTRTPSQTSTDCNVLRTLLNVSFNLHLTLHVTLTHFSNKLHKTFNCSIMHLLKIGKKVKD